MNHKSLPGRAMVKDAAQGIAELVVSAYGNVDYDGDIVEKGAVAKQIAGEYGPNPKGLLDHDWSMRSAVAKTLRMWEEDDGTHIDAQYNLGKQVGREAFDDLSFYGDDMEFSVGYEIKNRRGPNDAEKLAGAKQVITEWQLNEWSHVMLGANSATRLVAAKAACPSCTQAFVEVVQAEGLADAPVVNVELVDGEPKAAEVAEGKGMLALAEVREIEAVEPEPQPVAISAQRRREFDLLTVTTF